MKKIWNKKDDDFLFENYPKESKKKIMDYLKCGWGSIQHRASRKGIKRLVIESVKTDTKYNQILWDDNDIDYLIKNYQNGSVDEITKKLNRGWNSIQQKAFQLKLNREKYLYGDASKLSDGSNKSYYWLGFIMADGHFNKNKQININLSEKDISHLLRFAKHINYNKLITEPRISVSYYGIDGWLYNNFNITSRKTYNPINLKNMSGDNLFSFIIGFIDGDGSIGKDGYLRLSCHSSWYDNLNYMVKNIGGEENCRYICDGKMALVLITNIEVMKSIKKKIVELKLPVLKRKWGRVKYDKLSKKENFESLKTICLELLGNGMSVKDIHIKTNIGMGFIYRVRKTIKSKDIERDTKRELKNYK